MCVWRVARVIELKTHEDIFRTCDVCVLGVVKHTWRAREACAVLNSTDLSVHRTEQKHVFCMGSKRKKIDF